jgi:hypothetical protein
MEKEQVKNRNHLYIYRAYVIPTSDFSDSQDLSIFRVNIS